MIVSQYIAWFDLYVIRPWLELKIPEQMIWCSHSRTQSTILTLSGDYFYDFKAQKGLICFGVGMVFSG